MSTQRTVRRRNAMYIVALFHNKRGKKKLFGLLMLCGEKPHTFSETDKSSERDVLDMSDRLLQVRLQFIRASRCRSR